MLMMLRDTIFLLQQYACFHTKKWHIAIFQNQKYCRITIWWDGGNIISILTPEIQQQLLLLLLQPFYGLLSGTTRVSRYQKKHSPTHHPDHHSTFISFFHLLRSIASSLFKLRAWQSAKPLSKSSLVYLLVWSPPTRTQSVSSFRNTCPYHRSLFCCSTKIISSIPSVSLNSLLGTLNLP